MLRTIWLSSAVLLGLGCLATVGAPLVLRPAADTATAALPRVASDGKGDNVAPLRRDAADDGQAGRDLLRAAMNDRTAETQLAPLIFAPSSGVAAPLMPASDDSAPAAAAVPGASDGEANATPPAGNWRDANAKADASETDAEMRRPARKERVRKPRVTAARAKPSDDVKTPDPHACVPQSGFNGFLASINLKPRCAT